MDIGNIKYHFFGHDHCNDFYGQSDSEVEFYFGRKSGFGGYGCPENPGARVITITENLDSPLDKPTFTLKTVIIDYL